MITQKNEIIIKTLFNELKDNNLTAIDSDDFLPITLNEMLDLYRNGMEGIILSIEDSNLIHVGEIDFDFKLTESCCCIIQYSESLTNLIPKTILFIKAVKNDSTYPMFELKVHEQINHFNQKVWFEVTEMECGSVLSEYDTEEEAIQSMNAIIAKEPNKYFTMQQH